MASMSDISVLVVEDDPQTLATVAQAIAREPGLHLLAAVETAREAETCLANFVPDVLLTDLGLPDGSGIDLIQLCAARHPRCDAMVITMFADERNVLDAIDAGAKGYILKDADDIDVARFIRDLRGGGSPMSPRVARQLLARVRRDDAALPRASATTTAAEIGPGAGPGADAARNLLTPREHEILNLIARGYAYGEIAQLLGVVLGTVQTHIKNIYAKLSVHSRSEAVFEAHKLGLLQQGLLAPVSDAPR